MFARFQAIVSSLLAFKKTELNDLLQEEQNNESIDNNNNNNNNVSSTPEPQEEQNNNTTTTNDGSSTPENKTNAKKNSPPTQKKAPVVAAAAAGEVNERNKVVNNGRFDRLKGGPMDKWRNIARGIVQDLLKDKDGASLDDLREGENTSYTNYEKLKEKLGSDITPEMIEKLIAESKTTLSKERLNTLRESLK